MRPIHPLLFSSLVGRETPQELSHDRYILQVKQMLDLNNTLGVQDPTYGLLINSMAVTGMGSVTDPDCLQLSIADSAFTNAKATNNIEGLVAALIYRALERNTPAVGVPSGLCTSFTPINPELSTFKQHQDPASPGALANNKGTVLELARQIYLIGGNATEALYSGTFAPGSIGDNDTAGNSCDTADCIFEGDLLVRDASESEVTEYVAKCTSIVTSTVGASGSEPTPIGSNGSTAHTSTATSTNTIATTTHTTAVAATSVEVTPFTSNPPSQTTVRQAQVAISSTGKGLPETTPPISPPPSTLELPETPTSSTLETQAAASSLYSGFNEQTFTGAVLGVAAPPVTGPDSSGNYYVAADGSTFSNLGAALGRSCDIQHNNCANFANQQRQPVSLCDTQLTLCMSQSGADYI